MNASILCLAALLSADPAADGSQPFYTTSPVFMNAIRGQDPQYDPAPTYNQQEAPIYSAPPQPGYSSPFGAPAPMVQDPFLRGPGGVTPYGGGPQGGFAYGANGPQPYRFGWTPSFDVSYLPNERTDPGAGLGRFGIFGVDTDFKYTTPFIPGWILSFTQEFDFRSWDGPSGVSLPPDVYRFGWDFVLQTPDTGGWSVELGFNPSINADLTKTLNSDAWNWDGHGVLYLRTSPQWMWAFGAGYLDRVNDRVIPYGGVVWNPPGGAWEWRIMFPKSRVSVYLGKGWFGEDAWLYARGEYHIEAYQIQLETTGAREKIELEDWRVLLGLRCEYGWASGFVEAGWVFERDVDFLRGTPGFDISSGFIGRMGLRF